MKNLIKALSATKFTDDQSINDKQKGEATPAAKSAKKTSTLLSSLQAKAAKMEEQAKRFDELSLSLHLGSIFLTM